MYFVRITTEPEADALRNFEAKNVGVWFKTEGEAIRYQQEHGIHVKARLCPLTNLWCASWEEGLKGWKIYDQNSMEVVLSKIKAPFGIFYSDVWSDGPDYDVFS